MERNESLSRAKALEHGLSNFLVLDSSDQESSGRAVSSENSSLARLDVPCCVLESEPGTSSPGQFAW